MLCTMLNQHCRCSLIDWFHEMEAEAMHVLTQEDRVCAYLLKSLADNKFSGASCLFHVCSFVVTMEPAALFSVTSMSKTHTAWDLGLGFCFL